MPDAFLTGPRLYLRRLTVADVSADYVAWLNDPEVTRFLETGKFPSTHESVRAFLERFDATSDQIFAIVDTATDQHVGNVTLNRVNWIHRTADTGLLIGRREFRGRGYAHEAWSLVASYAFGRLGLRKLIAGVVDGNIASQRSLEKLGFRVEGRLRAEYWIEGEVRDALRLGLLRDEFVPAAVDERGAR
jgi:[ribosomal protein S5]-alanine N-acetyltransferase